jgi:uncharacterized protein YbjT (DUF2867 family)
MILIVGATGSLGSSISRALLARGEPVRVLVRGTSDYSHLQAARAEIAPGDLRKPESVVRACRGIRRIVATATAASRGGDDTVEGVDRRGYEHLIAAARSAGVEQFVFVSAHGFSRDSPVALARAKVATEEALERSGLNYTILRPALFMESWISVVLGSQIQVRSRIQVMGDPERRYPFVSARNVADLALAVLGHPDCEKKKIPLSVQSVSFGQLVQWISEVVGRTISVEPVPPGSAIPGLPPVVIELWSWAAEFGFDPIETVEVAVKFGLALEAPRAYIRRTFGQVSPAP